MADAAWEPFRERFPDAFDGPDRIRTTYRCYLVRSQGQTILVDTGMGPDGSPLSGVFGHGGTLMDVLPVAPEEIDVLLCTTEEWKEYPVWTAGIKLAHDLEARRAWALDVQMR